MSAPQPARPWLVPVAIALLGVVGVVLILAYLFGDNGLLGPARLAANSGPPRCNTSGSWDAMIGGQPTRLTLRLMGGWVEGAYTLREGVVAGPAGGDRWHGVWAQAPTRAYPNDAGEFDVTLASDCNSFTGRYRAGTSGAWQSGWDGKRAP